MPDTYPKNILVIDLSDWLETFANIKNFFEETEVRRTKKAYEFVDYDTVASRREPPLCVSHSEEYKALKDKVALYDSLDNKCQAYSMVCQLGDEVCLTPSSLVSLAALCARSQEIKEELNATNALAEENKKNIDRASVQDKPALIQKQDLIEKAIKSKIKEQREQEARINQINSFLSGITPSTKNANFSSSNLPPKFEGVGHDSAANYMYASYIKENMLVRENREKQIRLMEVNIDNEMHKVRIINTNEINMSENYNAIPILDIRNGNRSFADKQYFRTRDDFKLQIAEILAAKFLQQPVLEEIVKTLQEMRKKEQESFQKEDNLEKSQIYHRRAHLIWQTLEQLNEAAGSVTYKEMAILLKSLKEDLKQEQLPLPSRNPIRRFFDYILNPVRMDHAREQISDLINKNKLDPIINNLPKPGR